ncbi:hypothetical protein [Lonsdalea populi]|uniref:hypothetical protein n=1 Tax=Lonsdalea populi TaxID=1172565 RepID=UPI001301D797|nr:hypothetical protein [Lonsdalea populi]
MAFPLSDITAEAREYIQASVAMLHDYSFFELIGYIKNVSQTAAADMDFYPYKIMGLSF